MCEPFSKKLRKSRRIKGSPQISSLGTTVSAVLEIAGPSASETEDTRGAVSTSTSCEIVLSSDEDD